MSNPLEDVVPARHRKRVYAIVALAALAFSAYQAAQGDWTLLVGGLLTSLTTGTAASNTSDSPPSAGDPLDP